MADSVRMTAAALALAALAAGCAAPQQRVEILPPPRLVDADGDGEFSAEEWTARGDALFDRLDADGDGALTPEEMQAGFEGLDLDANEVLGVDEVDAAALDLDGDGVIDRAEWSGSVAHAAMDADRNRRITRDEFHAARRPIFDAADLDGNARLQATELSLGAPRLSLLRF